MNKWIGSSIALAFAIGLVAAWYLLSPLVIDKVVDEELPTISEVKAMNPVERVRAMEKVMAAARTAPDREVSEMMPTGPTPLKTGVFTGADALHQGAGMAIHYRLEDDSEWLRFEDFAVTNGPALVVYLVEHPNPKMPADVTAGFHSLGKLKGNRGSQNYVLPADLDVSQYNSVVIWCELFSVLFAAAPLKAPG